MLTNVKAEVQDLIRNSPFASEIARCMDGSFYIESYQNISDNRGQFESLFCKPSNTLSSALLIDREILTIISKYPTVQARTLRFAQAEIRSNSPRLNPNLIIVVHCDPSGNQKLRTWGREQGIVVIPFYTNPSLDFHGAVLA
jgi:hypothetical protein